MRMWMINTKVLCRKHLLGEHNEIHKHRPSFVKKHSIIGRIAGNAVEPESMKWRHDALSLEMMRRGYNHASPYEMPSLAYLPIEQRMAKVNTEISFFLLIRRCADCRKRANEIRVENG